MTLFSRLDVGFGREKGFSLVDALIVVGILGVLTAIAIPNLILAKISVNESSARSTLNSVSAALESYARTKKVFPSDPSSLIGVNPPYLSTDYFVGVHGGYTFTHTLSDDFYTITATPANANAGTHTYVITTGGVLHEI